MNDVNVRKCEHFKAWYESRPNGFGGITIENYCYLYGDNCEKHPRCLYRSNQLQQLETQLKRKEEECEKYKQALYKIKNVIKNLENENILTFPDLSLQENVKAIMAQCNSGYKQILGIINKAKEQ